MSNSNQIKEDLKRIISEKIYDVAILKGEWGIGKTFLWTEIQDEILLDTNLNGKYNKDSFIYISLFGLASIQEIKDKLIFKTKTGEVLDKTFKGLKDLKVGGISASAITVPLGSFFEYFLDEKIRNKVIVFDDIERKNEKLDILTLLGLINELKSKDNQILIMLNEEKINDSIDKQWHIFKEKILDIEYKLEITSKDCFDIIKKINIEKFESLDEISREIIESSITNLELKNIRIGNLIFKRIIDILNEVKLLLKEENKDTFLNTFGNIAKIFHLHFNNTTQMKNDELYKYIEKYANLDNRLYAHYYNTKDRTNLSKEENQAIDLLGDLGINLNEKITKIILNYIKTGYIDKDSLNLEFLRLTYNTHLLKNELQLLNFMEQLCHNLNIDQNFIDENFNFLLNQQYSNYNQLYELYLLAKKMEHAMADSLLTTLKNKISEKKWVPNPSILKEDKDIREELSNNNIPIILEMLSFSELIRKHSFEWQEVEKTLNELTIFKIKELILKESNMKLIFEFSIAVKDEKRLENFNTSFRTACNDFLSSKNPDYKRIKQIILLSNYK